MPVVVLQRCPCCHVQYERRRWNILASWSFLPESKGNLYPTEIVLVSCNFNARYNDGLSLTQTIGCAHHAKNKNSTHLGAIALYHDRCVDNDLGYSCRRVSTQCQRARTNGSTAGHIFGSERPDNVEPTHLGYRNSTSYG